MVSVRSDRHKGPRDFVPFGPFVSSVADETAEFRGRGLNFAAGCSRSLGTVRTSALPRPARKPPASARGRSRFGYDRRWWGEAGEAGAGEESYWSLTRRPLPSLAFLLPILLAYEVGIAWAGAGPSGAPRTGVDAWLRRGLAGLGLTDRWLPPLALVVALLGWQAVERRSWRVRPGCLLGMAAESLVLALTLVGLSRLVDLGLAHLDEARPWLEAGPGPGGPRDRVATLLGYLGAGVYEEAVFRLALVPLGYGLLRLLMMPRLLAGTLAVTGSSLLFSIAHHAGVPGEPFTWYAFFFRWVAGVFFAWVFVVRGFGIAVGTHAAYDILVGWLAA